MKNKNFMIFLILIIILKIIKVNAKDQYRSYNVTNLTIYSENIPGYYIRKYENSQYISKSSLEGKIDYEHNYYCKNNNCIEIKK